MNIDPSEKNPFVLLATIGSRGPSSFIFAPVYHHSLSSKAVQEFRKQLGLTTREFAHIFEITQASLSALERGTISGREILKRLELIVQFPEVALYYLHINGYILINERFNKADTYLQNLLTLQHPSTTDGPFL